MRATHKIFAAMLTLSACTSATDGSDAPTGEGQDFRDGSYFYVLGFDPQTGEQIRGGAHAVVGFRDGDGKTEPIDSQNRVARFHPDVREGTDYYRFDGGLTQGETDWEVFPSTWWPQSRNGTAWRWQPGASEDYGDRSDVDRLSPLEKYDLLFHPGQERVVEAVSHCRYADYVEDPDNCEEIEHPEVTVAGPATEWELENQGVYQWVEPESWWGHCNGWASYATTEPLGYPRRDIRVRMEGDRVVECTGGDTEGCILWRMADIEALFTELYFSDQATFSGRRCNTRPDEIERDEFGRPTEVACRDLNPGSFHIAVTSMFGHGARNLATGEQDARPAFVIDHNWDHEIWNFPIVSFRIDSQAEVTAQEAQALVGGEGEYTFNPQAERFVRVTLTYEMISDGVPAHELFVRADQRDMDPVAVELNYVLELDASDEILGGEWIENPTVTWGEDSKELHPDFIWMATDAQGWGEGSDDLGGDNDNPFVSYSAARQLLLCANQPETCAASGGGGGGTEVLLDLTANVQRNENHEVDTGIVPAGHYTITLSHDPAQPGGDADLYVRVGSAPTTSAYDCRPYLGGTDEVCEIDLAQDDTIFVMVRGWSSGDNAFRLTVQGEDTDGGGGGQTWDGLQEGGTIARNEEQRFSTPQLPAGSYVFDLSGNGDADLYVRRGAAPSTSQWDCRPYSSGSDETCTVVLSEPDQIHVMVRGYAQSSTYELTGAAQ